LGRAVAPVFGIAYILSRHDTNGPTRPAQHLWLGMACRTSA
jgi:hypothetical protein